MKGGAFTPSAVATRADAAWAAAGEERLTLHQCRRTFGSTLMAVPGEPVLDVSRWMGHPSVQTTLDLYGPLQPKAPDLARERLAAYLERIGA